ncbi:MAG TPA: electron transfer flavoprotein subunit beta, partial [Desulfobacteraceae bacterium]|nr:electron transfer flavoprotein subunit beta [Desulfobacteraceae bacterium]
MDIVICIKEVPETTDVPWDPKKGTLIREGIPGILNPNDKNAIEAALQLTEKYGGVVTAISMGPTQTDDALREALSLGVDNAVLLTDRHL